MYVYIHTYYIHTCNLDNDGVHIHIHDGGVPADDGGRGVTADGWGRCIAAWAMWRDCVSAAETGSCVSLWRACVSVYAYGCARAEAMKSHVCAQ